MDIGRILERKAELRPKEGFNVVGVDHFEPPGPGAVYLVGNYKTREEAQAEIDKRKADKSDQDTYHIYEP